MPIGKAPTWGAFGQRKPLSYRVNLRSLRAFRRQEGWEPLTGSDAKALRNRLREAFRYYEMEAGKPSSLQTPAERREELRPIRDMARELIMSPDDVLLHGALLSTLDCNFQTRVVLLRSLHLQGVDLITSEHALKNAEEEAGPLNSELYRFVELLAAIDPRQLSAKGRWSNPARIVRLAGYDRWKEGENYGPYELLRRSGTSTEQWEHEGLNPLPPRVAYGGPRDAESVIELDRLRQLLLLVPPGEREDWLKVMFMMRDGTVIDEKFEVLDDADKLALFDSWASGELYSQMTGVSL